MTTRRSTHVQLDRAHVEGKVIESSLNHLGTVLVQEDKGLRDELKVLIRSFQRYMGRLGDASTVASDAERIRETQNQETGDVPDDA
jgi:hypothetical protein